MHARAAVTLQYADNDAKGMSTLQQWCQAMERTFEGKIALSNIRYDCHQGNLAQDLVRGFFAIIARKWEEARAGQSPQKLIQDAIREHPDSYVCQSKPPLPAPQKCSRLMTAKDFVRDNVQCEKLGWCDAVDYIPEEHLVMLEQDLTNRVTGEMPHPKPDHPCRPGWVTKTEAIDALRNHMDAAQLANVLRNKLGLLHYTYEDQLVEITYPDDAMARTCFTRPTFLDGAPYLVYRSKSANDGWGVAVDLTTGDDGLPEAVHLPVPITGQFKLRRVGWLRGVNMHLDFDDLWHRAPLAWEEGTEIDLERLFI